MKKAEISTDHELTDEDALAFHRHCVELELEQACKPPVDSKSVRAVAMEGTSPFVLAHQRRVQLYSPEMQLAAKLSHDTIILRSGLGLGFIDPMTGCVRE